MRTWLRSVLVIVISVVCFNVAGAQTVDSNFVDGVVYFKIDNSSSIDPVNNGLTALQAISLTIGLDSIVQPFPGLNTTLDKTYRVHFSQFNAIGTVISTLQALSFVEYAEKAPLYKIDAAYTPNDLHSNQDYLDIIYARDAWAIEQGSGSIVVAIVDNGVRLSHEDLTGSKWVNPTPNSGLLDQYPNDVNGWDVSDNDNNPSPPAGTTDTSKFAHGTICAGIAAASTNNGVGVASLGFNIKFMAVKCSPNNSNGNSLPDAYDGLYYAIQAGADIISMSWGGTSGAFLTGENLINSAHSDGIVLVAAAGNEGDNLAYYPAAYNHVISVGSTDDNDAKSSFSNYHSSVDVMAPGRGLYTVDAGSNQSYGYASGTSMSTPVVAGLIGLMKSQNPSLTPDQLETQLKQSCDNIDAQNPSFVGQIGAGRINAVQALGGSVPTGINNIAESTCSIYPNPASDQLSVKYDGKDHAQFNMYHVSGVQVLAQVLNTANTSHNIDVSGLAAGVYIIQLNSYSGAIHTERIVIKK